MKKNEDFRNVYETWKNKSRNSKENIWKQMKEYNSNLG